MPLTDEQKTEIQQEVARVLESLAMERKGEGNLVKFLLPETKADPLSAMLAADLASMMSSQVQPLEPLVRIIARAVEVLGNSEKALRWINAPVRSLGDQTPVSLLSSPEGIERVEDALGSIEHGVW